MTQTTHTPGPWKLADSCYSPDGYVWASDDDELVAVAGYDCSDLPTVTRAANACLIAAAPDLLAALQEMVALFADHAQYDDEGHELAAVTAAQSAIAKAKAKGE